MRPLLTNFWLHAATLAFVVAVSVAPPAQASTFDLRVSNAATASASTAELDVTLTSANHVAAIAFAIEFDATRLQCLSGNNGLTPVPNIAIDVPEGFVASSFFMAGSTSRIGITVYDPTEPIQPIPDGRIARLRFDTLPDVAGHAYVRIASNPPPSAAGITANEIRWNQATQSGGVTVTTRRAHLTFSPSALRFGVMKSDEAATRELVITNTGTAALRIRGVRIGGSDAFTLVDPPSQLVLPPNTTRSLAVTFRSSLLGSHDGHIELDVEQPTPSTRFVPLSGETAPDGAVVFDSRWLVPAAARLPGADESRWLTSLTLANTGDRLAELRLTFFGSAKVLGQKQLQLLPRATRSFVDVIGELFAVNDVNGFILIESSSPDLVARSTTGNLLTNGNEFAQSVPVLPWENLLHSGETGWLVGLGRTPSRRTNVSLINPGSVDAAIRIELRRGDGTVVGVRDYMIPPMLALQGVDLFGALGVTDEADLSAAVTCLSQDCVFFAYASTVGNGASPIFQSAR